jgi:putative nucleotidyltransferase with HDIG domain
MHRDVNLIVKVSAERIRDELFRILAGPKPGASLRALNILGVFPFILPELETLKKVQQSPPHHNDVWRHSLEVVDRLDEVLDALDPSYDPDKAANLFLGVLVLRLGRYRHQIAHLEQPVSLERPLRALLFFAALYHDVGKPVTQQVDEQGKIRFFGHDQIGAALAAERGRELRLNNQEIDRLKTIIRRHMWPTLMAQEPTGPGRRAVYRFFRATGPAGIDICLLSLADTLATYGPELSPDTWARHLDVVRILFEAWWEYPEQQVNPPAIVNGNDLMERFGLPPGPLIGELLELIREAQASAEISTAEEAYKLVESKI